MKFHLYLRFIFLLLTPMLSFLPVHSQITKIMGTVTNAATGEPIPFVNVYFAGSTIGSTSDFEGEYAIETFSPGDSLTASYIGYVSKSKRITPKIFQKIDFALNPDNILLEEVVILPGENPGSPSTDDFWFGRPLLSSSSRP